MVSALLPKHIVAVSALVRDDHNRVLMVCSPKRGWEMPGGQVEQGESLTQALEREIREEAGVTIKVGSLTGIYSNVKPPTKVIFGFLCAYVSGDLTTSDESPETAWVAPDDVLGRITHPAIYDRMSDMLTFSNQVIYRVYSTDPYHVIEKRWL
jgi:8-oxo-dGTP diphosphatase